MSTLRLFTVGTAVAAVLVLGFQATEAQQAAPKGNEGFKTGRTEVVELSSEIEGMKGRQLRLRVLNIEPGGHIGVHSHKNRPAVVYVIQGATTIYTADGKKVVRAGETSSATKDTTHWHINEGKEPVVFVAVDVFQPEK